MAFTMSFSQVAVAAPTRRTTSARAGAVSRVPAGAKLVRFAALHHARSLCHAVSPPSVLLPMCLRPAGAHRR
jgi:hypothetical protein